MRGEGGTVRDLRQHVVATIEFPIDEKWVLSGHLGSPSFFFPPAALDDTLKRLQKSADTVARQVEEGLGLPAGTLGAVYSVSG
jgi:hypothetical protein